MVAPTEKRIRSEDTKSKILESLLSEDLSALDLTNILEINESAVRRHLKTLEAEGLVEAYFEKSGKGRPKKYFTITDEGKKLFPDQLGLLLELTIRSIMEGFDKKISSELADLLVQELIESFPEMDEEDSLQDRVEKVAQAFDELGFYCDYSTTGGSYRLRFRNCAFGNLPEEEARWLCGIHKRVLQELLKEADIQQEKSMLEGDNNCVQRIGV